MSSDQKPVHVSAAVRPVIDTIQQNLQAAIRRKEAKEREIKERAERKLQRDEHSRRLLKDVVIEPPRKVARHATELPFPAVMFRVPFKGTTSIVLVSIDGRTWRSTSRYDDLVAKLTAAPEDKRMAMFKGGTSPASTAPVIVVPTGIFKIATPAKPS